MINEAEKKDCSLKVETHISIKYIIYIYIYMINEAKEKYYSLIVEPHIWYHIRIQYGNMSFIENIGYNAFRIHL
jgi:hypothetical protein